MKNTAVLILILLTMNAFSQNAQPSTGKIIHYPDFSSVFVQPRTIDVWLPDGYDPENRYAVLYMHDGQMLFDSAINWNHQEWGVDETAGALMKQHKIRDCIVVGIWNTAKRHSEYFPQKALEYLTPAEKAAVLSSTAGEQQLPLLEGGPVSDRYLKFIVYELKPFIDSNFATLFDQKNTFIAGSSMGGLISMYAICEFPLVFGGAACLSTHWPGTFDTINNPVPAAFLNYLRDHLPSPEDHKFYFDYGDQTLDVQYEPFQKQVDEILIAKGYGPSSWITKKFPGENHSEKAWQKRFGIPLLFLLGTN